MIYIDSTFITTHTKYKDLIDVLAKGFVLENLKIPTRHHHTINHTDHKEKTTLLVMPAWQTDGIGGVKLVTVNTENNARNQASIQGIYVLIDAVSGEVKAILDGKQLTTKRTAAASALASSFLSNKNASSLLVIGTGPLSKELVLAHSSIRPINQVFVWGRDFEKAKKMVASIHLPRVKIEAIQKIENKISKVDIISCATSSHEPLIKGHHLNEGQHIDLVGSYTPQMREADDDTMRRAILFIDTSTALEESGDLVIPIQKKIIQASDIQADLKELCLGIHPGRTDTKSITLFKSVGYALEDLIAADYYFHQHQNLVNVKNI